MLVSDKNSTGAKNEYDIIYWNLFGFKIVVIKTRHNFHDISFVSWTLPPIAILVFDISNLPGCNSWYITFSCIRAMQWMLYWRTITTTITTSGKRCSAKLYFFFWHITVGTKWANDDLTCPVVVSFYVELIIFEPFWVHQSIYAAICISEKTHLPLVPHICVSESGQHWLVQIMACRILGAKLLSNTMLVYC